MAQKETFYKNSAGKKKKKAPASNLFACVRVYVYIYINIYILYQIFMITNIL